MGHRIGIALQAVAHVVDQVFVFPPGDPEFLAAGEAELEGTVLAFVDPVSRHRQPIFFPAVAVDQLVARRAGVDVALRVTEKGRLDELALALVARGSGARDDRGDALLMADQNLGSAEVALVGNGVQVVPTERFLGGGRNWVQLVAVDALVGDVTGNNYMGLGIPHALRVVANEPAVPSACCHRAGVRIGQGYLAIKSVGQGLVHRL